MSRATLRALVMTAAVALTTTAIIVGAVAGQLPVRDNDDTRGPLDIRRVTHSGGSRPRWNVITFEGWKTRRIFDVGYVTILLDTVAGERPDYYVLVGSFGRRIYAHLWRDRARRPDYKIGRVKVWKPSWKNVAIKLPLSRMDIGSRRLVYRWQVETLFTGPRCRKVCFDLAPDSEAVAEPLPGLTQPPSPTPSVTPTPAPSGTPTPEPTSS